MPKKNQPNYKEYETELERQIRSKEFRPVYLVCGEQDYLHGVNIDFKKHMEKLDFDYSYFESEGIHNWDF